VTADQLLWMLARVTGLSAYVALSLSVLSGAALRSGLLAGLGSNRALRSAHEFMAILWIPLGLLHLVALLLDRTARVSPVDVVVPFVAGYDAAGRLAVGLGAVGFDLVVLVAVTGRLRGRMGRTAWTWIHRLAYPAFALSFLHAALSGTDFDSPAVSALAWAAFLALAVVSLGRVLWGRLPAG
jgi:DMSO/TMAO reductase YedYZ heme-binding membrane subunit